MPREYIYPETVEQAVQTIIPYLEDTSSNAHKAIYFDGWKGLGASAVLRAIAKDPPPSLLKKFDKMIHVDCSRWKSRRALQRTIAQELKLPQRVTDMFHRQDEEDDFKGIDEGSRVEIELVGREILQILMGQRCLVIFHNGSNDMVNISDYGILQGKLFDTKVLWTFRGRLRLNSGISEMVDSSHLFIFNDFWDKRWNYLLQNEAREIAGYTHNLGATVEECCLFLLSLNCQGGNNMDYNWATHASNYWVCDGIIQGGQGEEAWKVAAALHQHINIEDYSSNTLPSFGHQLQTPPKRWILSKENSVVHPDSTSFFLAAVASGSDPPLRPLPNDMFHQSDKLRVLKLCHCTFSFSAPPFCCCHNLRFLGLDGCKDQQADEKQDRPAMGFFQSLWVLDICHTDWELDLSANITEQMAANIREVHIKKGRIWCHSFAWRQLQNLHKLRVIEPTSPWQTREMDDFTDTVKLEFLDLSGDSAIQVLPSLSGATSLKTLVLDGCVALEHLGPEALPPSLESFSLDARSSGDQNKEAIISHVSLAGCGKLMKFRLCGSLPNLEELDLSGTLVKTLDLKEVQAPSLHQIVLLGCMRLRAILWPIEGLPTLKVVHIDSSSVCQVQTKLQEVYVTIMDIRFFQSLVLKNNARFCWKNDRFHLNLCVPCTTNVKGESYMKEKMGPAGNSGKIMGLPQPKSLNLNTCSTYIDVFVGNINIDHDYNTGMQFQPSGYHVEIGKGVSNASVESVEAIKAMIFAMNQSESLHVHGNSSITTVITEHIMSRVGTDLDWKHLKHCHVVRCPKMRTVFMTNYCGYPFQEIETFWAADLPMSHCIWSKGRTYNGKETSCFAKLRSIHLYSCPRLAFVLPLLWGIQGSYLHNLESLHIINCGDLKTVCPVHPGLKENVLEFPSLKHIHLYELYKLQHICEVKMHAPNLERVWLRGCWGLRRLPSVGGHSRRRPVVDCEQDWWEKLEWDGVEAGHDPCLFERRHPSHYKKPLPRVSVLR